MNLKFSWLIALLFGAFAAFAQAQDAPKNWFHLDPAKDGFPGVASQKMYQELLKSSKGEPVVVAVLDGGVDYMHDDLRQVMWANPKEIAGNGIDDDKNGYVDDVHGWNFIGNKNGENIQYDNIETTRLYKKYKDRFENADPSKMSKADKALYEEFRDWKDEVEKKREELKENMAVYGGFYEAMKKLKESIKKDEITLEDLKKFKSTDPLLSRVAVIAISMMTEQNWTFSDLYEGLKSDYEHIRVDYEYKYNPDYESRQIVGDNYADVNERYYGNPNVKGPDAEHGTHVAGIIAAERDNGVGMDGIAANVRIMAVRVVPDGDERDKDVANAIIYAVNNGAKVINMSFGKGYSPEKDVVDRAVKYALKNDVLLVHAAGNEGKENFPTNNFPNDKFVKKGLFSPKFADNWIEVGAVDWHGGDKLAADFSNYSPDNVDVFAPGVDIYSTVPENKFRSLQGTSMAAPVVSGIAAVLRSYFPDLTAKQVKNILMSSVDQQAQRVAKPGSEDKVPFSRLALSGGTVNAYNAFKLASETKGKKKGNRYFGPYSTGGGKKAGGNVVVP